MRPGSLFPSRISLDVGFRLPCHAPIDRLARPIAVLRQVVGSPAPRNTVTLLTESGEWEMRPWWPVCLAAEAMWDRRRVAEAVNRRLGKSSAVLSPVE